MTNRRPPLPTPPPLPVLPLKDALRGLRFGLRLGREVLPPWHEGLPKPLRILAGQVIEGVDSIGGTLDSASSRLAHRVFDIGGLPGAAVALAGLADHPRGEAIFAQQVYQALRRALALQADEGALISEHLAARAFANARRTRTAGDDPARLAADLILAMDALGAIRHPLTPPSGPAPGAAREAMFAAMLWLLADRAPQEDEPALLLACCEAAHALRHEIAGAGDDPARLAALLARYAQYI